VWLYAIKCITLGWRSIPSIRKLVRHKGTHRKRSGLTKGREAEDQQCCETIRSLNLSARWLVLAWRICVWTQTLLAVKLNIDLVEHHWPKASRFFTSRVTNQISRWKYASAYKEIRKYRCLQYVKTVALSPPFNYLKNTRFTKKVAAIKCLFNFYLQLLVETLFVPVNV